MSKLKNKVVAKSVVVLGLTLVVALLTMQCAQSALMTKLTRNKPKIAVYYGLRPEGERVMELVYGIPRKAGSVFPEQFVEVTDVVKEELEKALPESEFFIPEHKSEFDAKVVAGIYLKGQYLKLFSGKYQLVIRAYMVFKDKTMRNFYGKDKGYEVAYVESDTLHIDEADDKFDRKMIHQGLEAIMEEHPPLNLLPKLKEELRKNIPKLVKKL